MSLATADYPRTLADLLEAVERLRPVIEEGAVISETERRLADGVYEAMFDAGLFAMLAPQAYGGLELHILDVLEVWEAVARIDSAAAWNLVMNQSIATFAGWLPAEGAKEVFSRGPGTGSADIAVSDLFVPDRRTMPVGPLTSPAPGFDGPLYRMMPFPPILGEATVSVGVAAAAVDQAIEVVATKTPAYQGTPLREQQLAQHGLGKASRSPPRSRSGPACRTASPSRSVMPLTYQSKTARSRKCGCSTSASTWATSGRCSLGSPERCSLMGCS